MPVEKNGKGRVIVTPVRADELPKAGSQVEGEVPDGVSSAGDVEWEEAERPDVKTRFRKGNKAAVGRRPRMVKLGVPLSMCDVKDPRYRKLLRNAGTYRRMRCEELSRIHGFLSAGASSLVASASLSLAASKWMYTLAAETDEPGASAKMVTAASKLAGDARQLELTAWELAARESAAVKAQASNSTPAWLIGRAKSE